MTSVANILLGVQHDPPDRRRVLVFQPAQSMLTTDAFVARMHESYEDLCNYAESQGESEGEEYLRVEPGWYTVVRWSHVYDDWIEKYSPDQNVVELNDEDFLDWQPRVVEMPPGLFAYE